MSCAALETRDNPKTLFTPKGGGVKVPKLRNQPEGKMQPYKMLGRCVRKYVVATHVFMA